MFTEILEPDFEIGTILLLITNHTNAYELKILPFRNLFLKILRTKPNRNHIEPNQSNLWNTIRFRFLNHGLLQAEIIYLKIILNQ